MRTRQHNLGQREGWWSSSQTVKSSSVLSARGGNLPSVDEWRVTGALEMGAAEAIVVGSKLQWTQCGRGGDEG